MLNSILDIILAFMLLLAAAQVRYEVRRRRVRRYFRNHAGSKAIVCSSMQMMSELVAVVDRETLPEMIILEGHPDRGMLEWAVRNAGVMRYPCLLVSDGDSFTARHTPIPAAPQSGPTGTNRSDELQTK